MPPLARGAHGGCVSACGVVGLVPAGAGSTQPVPGKFLGSEAHPRWRGEHRWVDGIENGYGGSSPLARGAHLSHSFHRARPGLIPAGAGSTGLGSTPELKSRAHPRWRGEHWSWKHAGTEVPGSSPLARGALPDRTGQTEDEGLIPAGAGSTASWDWVVVGFSAHPRWRGEHLQADMRTVKHQGSSPLARGAPASGHAHSQTARLIPAGAGSTRT